MTVFGPDGSHWQDGILVPPEHWAGVRFVIWRASIGTRVDRTFAWAKANAATNGKAFCAYHFVYPCGRYPAAAQAATFHGAVGDTAIPCMLDWESDGTLAATWDDVVTVAEAISATGHRVPLVYTGKWYWKLKGSPTMSGYGLDLVNSHYGSNPPGAPQTVYSLRGGDGGAGWYGYGGLVPVIWQYGSRVTFGQRPVALTADPSDEDDPARPLRLEPGRKPGVFERLKRTFAGPLRSGLDMAMDMNAYRGDSAALHQWFYDPQYVPPPPPTPTPTPIPVPPVPNIDPGDDDDVKAVVLQANDDPDGPQFWWDGKHIGLTIDGQALNVGRICGLYVNPANDPLPNFSKAELRRMIAGGWADRNQPPDGYA